MAKADIIVTGAGPAGLTLSALLARAGFHVVLVDAELPRDQNHGATGRTAALLNGSINVIKAAGIWDSLKDRVTPLRTMRIVDDSLPERGRVSIEFKARDIGQEQFGFNIPNDLLRDTLLHHIRGLSAVSHIAPDKISDYAVEGQTVCARTEGGKTIEASLIIGTDGRHSVVRALSGIDAKKHDYTQIAMTCLIEHSKPHNFTSTEFHRSGGPFTFVPMEGNTSSVVWAEKAEDARRLLAMKRDAYQQAIQDRSCGLLGTITLKSAPESWPLMLLNARALTGHRAAIAAEAAHVMSPIGAQGLNLSLRDIAALTETLVDAARLGEDIGSAIVLERYAARRKTDIASRVIGIDNLNRAVANDQTLVKDLRRLGLKTLGNFPLLKNFIMHQGLAPALDKGRLISGSAL